MNPAQVRTGIFLFTTQNIEGYRVTEYYGLVAGHGMMGANFIKDFLARISDKVGGRVTGYEKALEGALNAAMEDMALKARKEGANAVIGVDSDTSSVGSRMLMASCYGTAVRIEPLPESRDEPRIQCCCCSGKCKKQSMTQQPDDWTFHYG